MKEHERIAKSNKIDRIMRKQMGELFAWEPPEITQTVGPYNPNAFDDFTNFHTAVKNRLSQYLESLSVDDLTHGFDGNGNQRDDLLENSGYNFTADLRELWKSKPIWYSGGFGHPDYVADFDYWGKMEVYTLHESLMLSVGVEPKHISKESLSEYIHKAGQKSYYPAIEFLIRRHELFFRKYPAGSYGKLRVPPSFLAKWFAEINLSVHPDFSGVIQERERMKSVHDEQGTGSGHSGAKPALTDKREIEKIAQLFTAMAIDQLGYDPTAKRSPIPKEIADFAAEMGLKMSDDTVRKYLKLGAKLIPADWKPK